jgi:hypothetical protein
MNGLVWPVPEPKRRGAQSDLARVKASKRLDLEKDTTILDLRLVCLEINAGGQSEDLARAIVELRIMLRALDSVVHHKAVAQVN